MQLPHPRTTIVVALAAITATVLFAVFFIPPPSKSADWAAWAQTVGSIVAIGVTAWLAFLPIRTEERRRQQERTEFLTMVSEAVDTSAQLLEPIRMGVVDGTVNGQIDWPIFAKVADAVDRWHASRIERVLGQLRDIPMLIWPNAAFYLSVRTFLDSAEALPKYLRPHLRDWSCVNIAQLRELEAAIGKDEIEYKRQLSGLCSGRGMPASGVLSKMGLPAQRPGARAVLEQAE